MAAAAGSSGASVDRCVYLREETESQKAAPNRDDKG
jgi:hypothetical protein